MTDRLPAPIEYLLKPGHIIVYHVPAVVYLVLGSCVAVSLWDRNLCLGGVCHYQYPAPEKGTSPTARFGRVALPKLLALMVEAGAQLPAMEAQIFGGADRPGNETGARNLEVATNWLRQKGIRVVSADTGGEKGRKVVYQTQTNEAVVYKATSIRSSDWYPYLDER